MKLINHRISHILYVDPSRLPIPERTLASSVVLWLLVCSIAGIGLAGSAPPDTPSPHAQARSLLKNLPLRFEPNQGQASETTRFVSRTTHLTVLLREAGIELRPRTGEAVHMNWANATGGTDFDGVDRLAGQSNYLRGSDPKHWHTGIPQFKKVLQRDVYLGIDVAFYGNGRSLEFDFVVSPGAEPDLIAMTFHGTERIEISEDGDLVLYTSSGELLSRRPRVYQTRNGVEQAVEASYVLQDAGRVGFRLAEHDPSLALIIDPVIEYGTHLGGEDDDGARAVTIDAEGNAFITGFAEASESGPQFPSTPGSFQPEPFGSIAGDPDTDAMDPENDAFILKLNPSGTDLVYSTFLGGGKLDIGLAIVIDDHGAAYVCGNTISTNFPTLAGAFQQVRPGFQQAGFVAKISPDGSSLEYGTYLGGSGFDGAHDLAVDPTGAVVVTGQTKSGDFPITDGVVGTTMLGGIEAFVTHLSADGSTLLFSTVLSGSGDDIGYGIALDADGNSYVAGSTDSADFPSTAGAFQPALAGEIDAFVAKLSATGHALRYATYLGGSADDEAHALSLQSDGSAIIAGTTESPDLPLGDSAFDEEYNGGGDVLIATLNPDGAAANCTYLGGSRRDEAYDVAVSAAGDTIVVGQTRSDDFPLVDASQTFLRSPAGDAFMSRITPAGELTDSTYYGSTNEDTAHGVALGPDGGVFMVGVTCYDPVPTGQLRTTSGSFQRVGTDDLDGFAVKFEGDDLTLPLITTEGVVNAAGFAESVAPDSIATAFVQNAADEDSIEPASPLPTERNGTSLEITDNVGVTRATGLFGIFNDGKQINFYVDPATAIGPATITLRRGDGATSSAPIEVKLVSPGIFFILNAANQNVALAQFLRISGGAAEPLQLTFNAADFSLVTIDLGPEGDQVFIALFGTGIRLVGDTAKITATIDGQAVPVLAFAAAAGFFGLDQVNVGPIPESFIGRGPVEVVLSVDGVVTNTVMVSFL